jgi:hypothetical protein
MATMSLRMDTAGWVKGLDRLHARYPAVIARSLNRAADSAKVAMTRAVAADLGIKQGDVTVRITTRVAKEFMDPHRMTAQVIARGGRIALFAFGARQTRKGVTARVQGGRRLYPGTFITTVGTGRHTGVFKRRGPARLPIVELFGPSIPHVFMKHIPVGFARAKEILAKNLQHETQRLLRSIAG